MTTIPTTIAKAILTPTTDRALPRMTRRAEMAKTRRKRRRMVTAKAIRTNNDHQSDDAEATVLQTRPTKNIPPHTRKR